MKVAAYSVSPIDKELLTNENQNRHEILYLTEPLGRDTVALAEGREAVLVFTNDDVSSGIIDSLSGYGVKYIATRSVGTDHLDREAAARCGIKLASVPGYSPQAIAEHTLALALALDRNLIEVNRCCREFDFRLSKRVGFNFHGKTVGIIGLGSIGIATAAVFKGLGCRIIGFDINPCEIAGIEQVGLNDLFARSAIISLHVPLTMQTKHLINKQAIALMKDKVMLLNTSRGGLMDTSEIITALETGKIGYLGLDVYEFEKGLFFENHKDDPQKDALLSRLMDFPNVLVTPHQAFLTQEALLQIAAQTLENLDLWEQNS